MNRLRVMVAMAVILVGGSLVGVVSGRSRASALQPGPYPYAVPFRSDGVLSSAPATVHQGSVGHVVFVVGAGGLLYYSSDYSGWVPLGAPPAGIVGDPAAVSWADGRIDVFVRGGDNKLWQIFTVCGGCQWLGWLKPVGDNGILSSSPTATSWAPGRIDVFASGIDGQVYQLFWDTNAWYGWLPRGGPPPGISDRPAAASWGPGRVDVFVRGKDNKLWQSFWTGSSWTGWFMPPGTEAGVLSATPAASPWGFGLLDPRPRLTVFVRGIDGHVYQATWDGAWAGWVPIGATTDYIVGAPGVASTLQVEPYAIGRGTDNRAYIFQPFTTRLVYTYSVASIGQVHNDINQFAAKVATTYADPRGWSLGDLISFVRVPSGGDFTVWLASPAAVTTFSSACSPSLSCRVGPNVIINDDRWSFGGLAPYPAPLDGFRTEEVNHETGHWLGLAHPCVGGPCVPPGQPAPVMMQQSKGMYGDLPNWWPLPYERMLVAGPRGLAGAANSPFKLPGPPSDSVVVG